MTEHDNSGEKNKQDYSERKKLEFTYYESYGIRYKYIELDAKYVDNIDRRYEEFPNNNDIVVVLNPWPEWSRNMLYVGVEFLDPKIQISNWENFYCSPLAYGYEIPLLVFAEAMDYQSILKIVKHFYINFVEKKYEMFKEFTNELITLLEKEFEINVFNFLEPIVFDLKTLKIINY